MAYGTCMYCTVCNVLNDVWLCKYSKNIELVYLTCI